MTVKRVMRQPPPGCKLLTLFELNETKNYPTKSILSFVILPFAKKAIGINGISG
jgi:hypothetical protein